MRARIFKLQISLNTAHMQLPPRVLVYDRRHEYTGEFPASPGLIEIFAGRNKMYVWAYPPSTPGPLRIVREAKGQRW